MFNRRAFLSLGKTSAATPWLSFVRRLRRLAHGTWQDFEPSEDGHPQACLTLERWIEFNHALALAHEYNIALVLEHPLYTTRLLGRPGLYLKLSEKLNTFEKVGEDACLVSASVPISTLLQKGYYQFAQVPQEITVAQWFADPRYHDIRPCAGYLAGVERLHGYFSNGQQAVMGGFGVNDQSPLAIPVLHQAIPQLFELLQTANLQEALSLKHWPSVYRIDALQEKYVASNLARLFEGHMGTLIWLQSLVIRKMPEDYLQRAENFDLQSAVNYELGGTLKTLFDPAGVYPYHDEIVIL